MKGIRDLASINREDQLPPACILWTDRAREWESVIPRLQIEIPELLVLGEYNSEKRTGPAIWLRCVIAGTIEGVKLPSDKTPVLYLPGFSRQNLRAVESCPESLKPLAELQYRGKIWSQDNSQDWTVMAFAKSTQDGLGLDVSKKKEVREAFLYALDDFLDEEVSSLKEKVLDQDYFGTLVTGGDPVRSLLKWLDNEEAFRGSLNFGQWMGFVQACKTMFQFDPKKEGVFWEERPDWQLMKLHGVLSGNDFVKHPIIIKIFPLKYESAIFPEGPSPGPWEILLMMAGPNGTSFRRKTSGKI